MRRRRATAEMFGLSFLDVLACALGAVLLLLLISVNRRAEEALAADTRARGLQTQLDHLTNSLAEGNERWLQVKAELDEARKALANAQQTEKEVAGLEKALDEAQRKFEEESRAQLEELQKVQASLIGLKGDLSNVAFVFDTSGSMAHLQDPATGESRFAEYKVLLTSWVLQLRFDHFNVVRFSTDVEAWQPHTVPGTAENRREAAQWIEAFKSEGFTNTLGAFEAAFGDPDVSTIVLFSDGEPTDQQRPHSSPALRQQVHSRLKALNAKRHVTINTVGMGNYFTEAYGVFLQETAQDHGGVFIGR